MEIDNHLSSFSQQNSLFFFSLSLFLLRLPYVFVSGGRDAAPRCCTETERNGMDSCFQCAVKRENFGTCKFLVYLRLGGAGSRERDKRDVAAAWHVFNSGAEHRRFPGRADLSSQPVPNFIEHLPPLPPPSLSPEITSSSRCHTLSTRLPMHLKTLRTFKDRESNEAKEHSFLKKKKRVARARAYIPPTAALAVQRRSATACSDGNLFAPSKPSAQKHFLSAIAFRALSTALS